MSWIEAMHTPKKIYDDFRRDHPEYFPSTKMEKEERVRKVIERLQDENRRHSIKILGDEKNKEDAFAVLMASDHPVVCARNDIYHGLKKVTIGLLNEAGIEFDIIR